VNPKTIRRWIASGELATFRRAGLDFFASDHATAEAK
jgi:hypothetical protein